MHCGFVLRSADKHVHTYMTVANDEHTHWGTCECGEILEPEVHTWNMKTGCCEICGTKNIPVESTASDNIFLKLWKQIWKK